MVWVRKIAIALPVPAGRLMNTGRVRQLEPSQDDNGAGILRYACSSYSFGVRSRRGKAYEQTRLSLVIEPLPEQLAI